MNAPPQLFDRMAHRRRRDRASATMDRVAPILRDTAERLLDRLDDTTHRFAHALDVGGRGIVAPLLRARGIETVSCDFSAAMAVRNPAPVVVADEELLPFGPEKFDLIVASLSLHWVNDLPGALIQLRRALRPDGLFLASLPAAGTLAELRATLTETEAALTGGSAPRIAPFPDLRDCAGLLQRAGFALPVADMEEIRLLYADPLDLLRDLRAGGETNVLRLRHRATPRTDLFPTALATLAHQDGRVPVTLRLAMLTGWAPAATQPRPLKPGTGRVSLIDAFKDEPPQPV
jgi:NADH dehydrogenase [ubiquinone] 1 alpha subcomplex assembly factor 5